MMIFYYADHFVNRSIFNADFLMTNINEMLWRIQKQKMFPLPNCSKSAKRRECVCAKNKISSLSFRIGFTCGRKMDANSNAEESKKSETCTIEEIVWYLQSKRNELVDQCHLIHERLQ